MKFKKKIEMCRMDDGVECVQGRVDNFTPSIHCYFYRKGICNIDKKKCKIVTYERIDK